MNRANGGILPSRERGYNTARRKELICYYWKWCQGKDIKSCQWKGDMCQEKRYRYAVRGRDKHNVSGNVQICCQWKKDKYVSGEKVQMGVMGKGLMMSGTKR